MKYKWDVTKIFNENEISSSDQYSRLVSDRLAVCKKEYHDLMVKGNTTVSTQYLDGLLGREELQKQLLKQIEEVTCTHMQYSLIELMM